MGYRTGLDTVMVEKKEDKKGGQTGFDKSVGNNTRLLPYMWRSVAEKWRCARCEKPAVAWRTVRAFLLFFFRFFFFFRDTKAISMMLFPGSESRRTRTVAPYKLIQRERTASGLSPSKKNLESLPRINTLILINIELILKFTFEISRGLESIDWLTHLRMLFLDINKINI